MRVVRGRAGTPRADRAVTRSLIAATQPSAQPGLRVWYPPKQAVFGPRDRVAAGYERARQRAADRGFEPVERSVGGRVVVHTGSTLAFVFAEPVDATSLAVDARYDRVLGRLVTGLESLGVDPSPGEPPDSFCPGAHSLSAGGKLAGLAQRVRRDVAVTGGLVIGSDADRFAAALEPLYRLLEIPFDPASVGSVAAAGGPTDCASIRAAVEDALVDGATRDLRTARGTYDPAAR